MGTVPPVSTVRGAGGVWARYEADSACGAGGRWGADGADYDGANNYDRAMIYYVWWARTGHPPYLERANQLALNARAYLDASNYCPQPYLMMIDGVALHAAVAGDPRSAAAVARTADRLAGAGSYWSAELVRTGYPSHLGVPEYQAWLHRTYYRTENAGVFSDQSKARGTVRRTPTRTPSGLRNPELTSRHGSPNDPAPATVFRRGGRAVRWLTGSPGTGSCSSTVG
jgi:hypothetical protein